MTNKNNLHCLFMNVMPNHLKNDGEDFFYNVKPTTNLQWQYLCSADVSGMHVDEDYLFEQLLLQVDDLQYNKLNCIELQALLSERFVVSHLTQYEIRLNLLNLKGIICEILYSLRNGIPYNYYVKQNDKSMYATKHFYKACKELVSTINCTTMFVSSHLDLCFTNNAIFSLKQLKQLPYSQIVVRQDVYEYLLAKQHWLENQQ